MIRPRWLLPAGLLLASLPILGCAEPIRTYEVPYVKQRMLGAIIVRPDAAWFVKLMGPADQVEAQKPAFEALVKSFRFLKDDKDPITWKLPDGWIHEPGKEMRHATFRLPNDLQVTLFRFGGDGGQVLPNVNRWRDQLNLDPIDGGELLKISKTEKTADEVEVILVDMESRRVAPVAEHKPPPPEPIGQPGEKPDDKPPFQYKLPEGWKEKPVRGGMSFATFTIADGDKSAELTTTLAGGSLLANVERWRDQVGLPKIDGEQMKKELKEVKVNGRAGYVVYAPGREKSILGCIVPGGDQSLFFKITGHPDVVAKNRTAFETFLASVSFRGGEKDE